MPGESVPQGLWLPPRTATLFVAASNALDRSLAQADYICNGAADDVEINAALNALPFGVQGRVILSEGDFILADPIVFPANEITLEGQGNSTLIDGFGLANNEHGIVISGFYLCTVKNLSIRTLNGGGNTSHCIFGEDGCHDLTIDNVFFTESDSDAIHIEGTWTTGVKILNCLIFGPDDHGIHIAADPGEFTEEFRITNNHIENCGVDGIHFSTCLGHYDHIIAGNKILGCGDDGIDAAEWLMEAEIVNNYMYNNVANGIRLQANCDNNLIENNYCNSNGGRGIVIAAASCSENKLKNNKLIGNTFGAVQDLGVYTQLPFIFVPVPEPGTVIGTHPATLLTDGLAVTDRIEVYIPHEFQELVRAHIVLVPGGTGNLRSSVATNWGEIGSGEIYNSDAGAIAAGEVAVNVNHLVELDISAAFTGVAPVAPDDAVGIEFTRHGNHVNDTVNANCYLLGVRIEYV